MSLRGRLTPSTTAYLLCDVQERFREVIHCFPAVVHVAHRMVTASRELKMPVIVTEQNPKALGKTVSEVDVSDLPVFAKSKFSMLTEPVLAKLKENTGIKSVLLSGIETHVCVQQTALELVEHGYDVHILADGVSSSTQDLRILGFERLRKEPNVFITSSDSALFMLLHDATHPSFKAISALIKQKTPDCGLSRL
eukprot:TRINITY_DN3194_c0_g2_i1.p1 TRINITY_DN3194_c0_g2~~TRINITY_DN3194_c0_g2_i1.p1  ORF type:complete len:195 (-),score=44.17 TRINITY_DN3194_c0_g2_i1:147-731(-)